MTPFLFRSLDPNGPRPSPLVTDADGVPTQHLQKAACTNCNAGAAKTEFLCGVEPLGTSIDFAGKACPVCSCATLVAV